MIASLLHSALVLKDRQVYFPEKIRLIFLIQIERSIFPVQQKKYRIFEISLEWRTESKNHNFKY